MHQQVSIGLSVTALGTGSRRGISAQLDLAFKQRIYALGIHHQKDKIGGLSTQLQTDVAAFQRIHSGRSPGSGIVLSTAAGHSSPPVAAANANGKLLYRR